jgi:hypothetical protein
MKSALSAAKRKEKSYKWLEAAKLYKQALGTVGQEDRLGQGEIQEGIGYCFRRAAMQTESHEEFRERTQRAVEAYKNASGCYESMVDKQKAARKLRCTAVVKYLGHWLTPDPTEKRKLLDDCLELEAKALQSFLASGDLLEYGSTYSALPQVFEQRAILEWSGQTRKKILERGVTWGEKAISALSEADELAELAKAYFTLATCRFWMSDFVAEPEKKEKNALKAVESLRKAVELAERTDNALVLGYSNYSFWDLIAPEEGRKKAEEALKCGERTRDIRLIAWSLYSLTYLTNWKAVAVEDPAQWTELMKEALKFYDRAHRIYSSMPFLSTRAGLMSFPCGYVSYYEQMAERESVIEKKLGFLKKAEAAGTEALRVAESSDSPDQVQRALAQLAEVQAIRAQTDSDLAQKRHCIEMALKFKERSCQIRDEYSPFNFWNRGVARTTLARHKMDLADVEPDSKAKQRLLEDAVVNMEQGLKLLGEGVPYYEKRGKLQLFAVLRRDQDCYATLQIRLYELTNKPQHLRRAIEISQKAIDSSSKLDLFGRMAESYWKMAKAQHLLGEHLEAAESFQYALESYRKAAEKIPQLKDFYQDYASYMQAWSEIEKARQAHSKEEYEQATEHYKQGADLHKATMRWNYLSPNYSAWARLEEAENLSRKDQAEKAREYFQQAAKLFAEAKKPMQAKLGSSEAGDEQVIVAELVNASDIRREYCLGRMAMEEAKTLDRRGDHASSSRRYGAAAKRFQQALNGLKRPRDRQELQPILYLTRAWQMMTRAEAEASPAFYLEAAKLFEEAKKHSADEKTKLLAAGHSSFCRALEAGARFEATRDVAFYPAAKKHLEAAAGFYLKAGFKTAVQYAIATRRLFDAYLHMTEAETETNPGRKALRYSMAERTLQASAGSFVKANHPEKEKQLHRLLEGVKEERQLAMSLTELARAPAITTSTTAFSAPSPTHETAAGLDRFEHAYIRARVSVPDEFIPGEEFQVKLDLANAGTKPGLLVRIEGVVPPRCKVLRVPSYCALEGASLNMRGRRLKPLCVESVSIRVQIPDVAGVSLSPQVVYVDELGNFRTTKLEKVKILPVVEFESDVAQGIFNYLVDAFVEDCVKRRLGVEKSGWRSFPQIIKGARVSKRSLYGSSGRLGHGLSELRRKRMVDLKTFLGERGRGGHILRVRIHHAKELVKRYVKEKAPNLLI